MPNLYASKWSQTKQLTPWCLANQNFVANSQLISCAFTCICWPDWKEFLFHSSQKYISTNSFSILHCMHVKSIPYWMTTNKKSHMVPFHQKICWKLIAKFSCLYLYTSMGPRRVPISLFSKINLSKAFSTLHCMNAKSICKWMRTNKTNHCKGPCHLKFCGKL